jgi:hypothetical protein
MAASFTKGLKESPIIWYLYIVKNIVRVCCLFSACFIFVLTAWTTTFFFQINEVNANMLTLPVFSFWEFLSATRSGIPFALYLSVLLGLSYTARKEIRIIPSIVTILLLAVGWVLLSAWAASQIPPHPYSPRKVVSLSRDGLIMTADNEMESSILLSAPPLPPAVFDGALKPAAETPYSTTPLSFQLVRTRFIQNSVDDFLSLADNFDRLQKTGFANLVAYIFGLVILLVSTRFIMDLSAWALANLFLGFIAFGGVLSLELFINASPYYKNLFSFAASRIPAPLLNASVLCLAGLLVMAASGAVYFAKKNKKRRTNV